MATNFESADQAHHVMDQVNERFISESEFLFAPDEIDDFVGHLPQSFAEDTADRRPNGGRSPQR